MSRTSRAERLGRLRARAHETGAWAQQRLPWSDAITHALERERFAAAGLLAGGLAYRLFFWLVPFGLALAALLGFWVDYDRAGLESAATEFGLGGAAAIAAADAIEQDAHSRWYFLVAGLALLGWFGPGVVRALHVTHAVAWGLRPTPVRHPFRAGWLFTGAIVMLLAVSAAAAVVREQAPAPGLALTLALVVLFAVAFIWASTLLPSQATHWRDFLPGALLLAIGTQLIHLASVYYLAPKLGRSSELYGTLGAATVVLLWLYLAARLVVAAAFLNAALWERPPPGHDREPPTLIPSG